MADEDFVGFRFGYVSRLITLAAAHWPEVSGAYRLSGKSLADEDITAVCEFTLYYFINTNEYRLASRKEIWGFVDPDIPQYDEDGNDERPLEQQMQSKEIMSEWEQMSEGFKKNEKQAVD
jgi:hypothetical protein